MHVKRGQYGLGVAGPGPPVADGPWRSTQRRESQCSGLRVDVRVDVLAPHGHADEIVAAAVEVPQVRGSVRMDSMSSSVREPLDCAMTVSEAGEYVIGRGRGISG